MATNDDAAYFRAIQVRQNIIAKWGQVKIKDTERRLCRSCHFWQMPLELCGLNQLMLPITREGLDCPYHIPKLFRGVVPPDAQMKPPAY